MDRSYRLIAAFLVAIGTVSANAAQYPIRPVRLVVPYAPGGGVDIVGRLVGQKLSERLGQSVVIDNRAGAGGTLGSELVQRASPDGYTLIINSTSYAVNANLYRMPYDPVDHISPITLIGTAPFVVVVHPSLPVKTIKELVEFARKNPDKLNYGSTGQGAITHLATELMNLMAGIRMTHVPYKGAGPALNDLLGGQLHLLLGSTLSTLPHVRSGKLRGIAVTSARRSPIVPDMPTVAEAGVPGYDCTLWYAVWGPPKLSDAIAARLNEELGQILSSADFKERLAQEGMVPVYMSRAELRTFLRSEVVRWGKVVKATGIRID